MFNGVVREISQHDIEMKKLTTTTRLLTKADVVKLYRSLQKIIRESDNHEK